MNRVSIALRSGVVVVFIAATTPNPVTAQAQPSFEVATVRQNRSGEPPGGALYPFPGLFEARNVSLRFLLRVVYQLPIYEITGGPGWVDTDRYDIVTKSEGKDYSQLPRMMETLVEERFKLKVRREVRELQEYALMLGKNGPRLRAAEGNCPAVLTPNLPPLPARGKAPSGNCGQLFIGRNHVYALSVSMQELGASLADLLERPVVDKTGLVGRFFIELEWAPAEGTVRAEPGKASQPVTDTGLPDIFTAIQEELGLRLEAQKGPAEVVVIEHVERPDPDGN